MTGCATRQRARGRARLSVNSDGTIAEVDEARIASSRRHPVELREDGPLRLQPLRPVFLDEVHAVERFGQRARDANPFRGARRVSTNPWAARSSKRLPDQAGRRPRASRLGSERLTSQPDRAKMIAQERPMRPVPTIATLGIRSPLFLQHDSRAAKRKGTREDRQARETAAMPHIAGGEIGSVGPRYALARVSVMGTRLRG